MTKQTVILFFLLIHGWFAAAQLVDPTKVDYDRELIFGITTNTSSSLFGGANLTYNRRYKEKKWVSYGLEIVNLQHNREIKVVGGSGSSYISGKMNYLFSIRPSVGFQHTLFQKDKQDGIRLNLVCSGGPSIGMLKPYYVEVLTYKTVRDTIIQTTEFEAYDPDKHSAFNILGSGGFFRGFGESSFHLGIHAKIGLNLEFAVFESNASGLEVGFMFENYFSDIQVHNTDDNQQFWSAFYVTLYFGTKYPTKVHLE